jgi:replicative superfamily II helicase
MDAIQGFSKLGIPEEISKSYALKGLRVLYDWQMECLTNSGVFSGNNLVYCAPTGGGKTLVAELVILKTAITLRKQSILVLPYISLVHEKERDFRRILNIYNRSKPKSERIKVCGYHSDSKSSKSYAENIIICTIERANMIINSLIVRGYANRFGCVVIDELHVLGDEQRGYHLEILVRYAHRLVVNSDY